MLEWSENWCVWALGNFNICPNLIFHVRFRNLNECGNHPDAGKRELARPRVHTYTKSEVMPGLPRGLAPGDALSPHTLIESSTSAACLNRSGPPGDDDRLVEDLYAEALLELPGRGAGAEGLCLFLEDRLELGLHPIPIPEVPVVEPLADVLGSPLIRLDLDRVHVVIFSLPQIRQDLLL